MSALPHARCRQIPTADKAALRLMFLAKHACGDGRPDSADGNHAVYHHEIRTTLESIGLDIVPADGFAAIDRAEDVDFVIPLLNRAGFENSEMLAPLMLARRGLPYLGARPILRGLADDKHLSKLVARAHGVPTADWQVYRRGGAFPGARALDADRLVVKPNASSASWGVATVESWADAAAHIAWLMDQDHDVLVEAWTPLYDVAVPVIGDGAGAPWILPPMIYLPSDPYATRSHAEKRGLVEVADDPLEPVGDAALVERLTALAQPLIAELWPFDYGRFEFRYDPWSGSLAFMEVNLSCNLWSRKTIARSAATLGIDHASLVETIVAHSLARQGVLAGSGPLEIAA